MTKATVEAWISAVVRPDVGLERLVGHPVAERIPRAIFSKRLVVLAYHGVEDSDSFDAQLDWLERTRTPISIEHVHDSIYLGRPLPPRPALVTFDDGRRSVLTRGLPILQRRGIPAALFVIAGLVGSNEPYWWNEVVELCDAGAISATGHTGHSLVTHLKTVSEAERLAAIDELRDSTAHSTRPYPHLTVEELRLLDSSGVRIGSHSLTHPMLDKCDDHTMKTELTKSRELLEDWLDRTVTTIAYPNGNADPTVLTATRNTGYDLGFLFDHRLQKQPIGDPLAVSRIRVDATASLDRFKALVSGLLPAIHRLRRRH